MKKFILLVFLSLALANIFSQTPGLRWQRPIGGTRAESLYRTLYSTDGNFIYAIWTNSLNGDVSGAHGPLGDIMVTKVSKEGIVLWSRTYGSNDYDTFLDLQNMPDGGYLLVLSPGGNSGDISGYQGNTDVWVAKLSPTGIIQWSYCFGGSASDNYNNSMINDDGSVIVYGSGFSTNGTFTMNHGKSDIFLCKINSNGEIAWLKCFGGTENDVAQTIYQKPNGSVIVTATTLSTNFDVQGNHGSVDIWALEVNTSGNIVWSKTFGGTGIEKASVFRKTGVAQYTMLAYTSSTNGDVTGYHGGDDLWVTTIDTLGNLLWQTVLGGTKTEIPQLLQFIPGDSTLLVSALSNSLDGDITGYRGGQDVWLVKLNNSGTIQWEKSMGGSGTETQQNILIDSNGNSIHLNLTNSINGDVVGNHGRNDMWVYKLNGMGNLLWQKSLGGSLDDQSRSIIEVPGGYTVMGEIKSRDGDISGMHYRADTVVSDTNTFYTYYTDVWIANLSATGNLIWQKSLGGFNNETGNTIIYNGGDYYISASTNSTDGDVAGSHGNGEGWTLRLGPTNSIAGKVFLDRNSNGIQDTGEPFYNSLVIKSEKTGYTRSSVPYNGWYRNEVDTGAYTSSSQISLAHYTIFPVSDLSSFNNYFNRDTIDFAIRPVPGKRDLRINIFPLIPARPGFDSRYRIQYQNVGTDTVPTGSIRLIKDSRTSFVSSVPAPASVVNDTVIWSFSNLKPLDSVSVNIVLNVLAPPLVNINDTLVHGAEIAPLSGDLVPGDNQDILKQRVVGAFDPNLKSENNAGSMLLTDVASGKYLTYTINFQNLGTDTAFTTLVRDTLENNLDWDSFEMLAASHPYVLSIKDHKMLSWLFSNIGLPHSSANDAGSKGFVIYRIKPKNNVVTGNVINNSASIYFDFNLPVKTNIEKTTINSILPSISSFSPTSAAIGESVTIIGSNFTGATAVSFGSVTVISFTVNSSTSITAVVGTGASGDVSVTTAGGTATLPGFTFIPSPSIASFTPTSGGTGASITITGTNLTGAAAVSFGGLAATSYTVNSPTSITAVVAAGASGNVSVTTAGGTATLAGFTFIPSPTIASFTPTSGGTGASVTITGTNLTGATAVSFGGVAATSFTVNSSTSITAITSIGASGNVSITTAGGTATLAGFAFIPAPTITSFTPTSGATGTFVTIMGTNLSGTTAASFGGITATSFTVNSPTSITAVVGAGASGNVSVVTSGGIATVAGFTFTVVTAIDPVPASRLGIRFYPNPTTGSFVIDTLKLSDKWETLEIFDTQGKKKLSNFSIRNKTRLDVNVGYLADGIYIGILKRKFGPATVVKFLKL